MSEDTHHAAPVEAAAAPPDGAAASLVADGEVTLPAEPKAEDT